MKLKSIREKIDQIDKQISILLNKRFKLIKEVKEVKKASGIAVWDKTREKQIIDSNQKHIEKEFLEMFKSVYLAIFTAAKSYEENE